MKLKPIDWIACIAISIAVGVLSYYLRLPLKNDGILYLLSTTSQALAAIFALVFTVTLVAAQIAQKYNAIDKFFNRKTHILMTMYVIGVILPILLLKIDSAYEFYNFLVSLSIGLAAFCIAAIIPYLKNCNDIIKFEIGVSNLIDELEESTISEKYPKAHTIVEKLREIGENAIQEEIEEPLYLITIGIYNHIMIALGRQRGILREGYPYRAIYALCRLGISATDKHMDKIAEIITNDLQISGGLVIDKDVRDSSAEEAINTLEQIGIRATKLKLKNTSIHSLISLLVLANKADSKGNWAPESEKAYKSFLVCASHFEKYFPEQIDALCNEIKSTGVDINKDWLNKTKDIIKKYPDVDGLLDRFIKRF